MGEHITEREPTSDLDHWIKIIYLIAYSQSSLVSNVCITLKTEPLRVKQSERDSFRLPTQNSNTSRYTPFLDSHRRSVVWSSLTPTVRLLGVLDLDWLLVSLFESSYEKGSVWKSTLVSGSVFELLLEYSLELGVRTSFRYGP